MSDRNDSQVVVYSTTWCPDCIMAKKVLDAMKVDYTDINIEQDPDAVETVLSINNGSQSVPTIVFADGSTLTEPSVMVLRNRIEELNLTG